MANTHAWLRLRYGAVAVIAAMTLAGPVAGMPLPGMAPQAEQENASGSGSTNLVTGTEKRISKSFAVQPGGKLIVDVDRGNIQITTADQNQVEILVEREIRGGNESQAARLLKDHQVTLTQEGDEVRVRAKTAKSFRSSAFWSHPNLNVHYRITVPRKFNLNLATAGGDVQAADLQGKIDARTSGGNITFTKIQGPVDARTSGGNLKAIGCTDRLEMDTSGGNVEIKDFAGPSVEATTSGGNISADFVGQPESNCSFRTSGGDIIVKIPGASAFNLDAGTSGGRVDSAIPVTVQGEHQGTALRGTINGGGPALLLKTSGGDVRLLKR
jgi:hypothetical protein